MKNIQEEREKRREEIEEKDTELRIQYEKTLDQILNNEDENAKNNMSDYMDELREESESLE